MDYSSPGSSVHGASQARILEWVAIPLSRGSSWTMDWTHVSCIGRQILPLSHQGRSYWYTQTKKKMESKHNIKDRHRITREQKKEKKETYKNKFKTINKMVIRACLSVNRLNAPIKRHRLAEWIQNQVLCICCLQEPQLRPRDTNRLKGGGVENGIPCRW